MHGLLRTFAYLKAIKNKKIDMFDSKKVQLGEWR